MSWKEVNGFSLKNARNSFNEAIPQSRPCCTPRISIARNAAGIFRAPKAPAVVSVAALSRLTRSASLKLPSACRSRSLNVHWLGSREMDVSAHFRRVFRNSSVDSLPGMCVSMVAPSSHEILWVWI